MHKLRRVQGAPGDYLADIVAGKSGARGTRLEALLPTLNASYAVLQGAYSVAGIGGVAQGAWTPAERADLLHCYEVAATALQDLKTLISERQAEGVRDVCPYCGIGAPRQFDHYLPKEKFPEFAVHSYNLVPCCGTCNGKKSDIWLRANGARTFLNLYLDSLPTAPMLETVIHWSVKKGGLVPAVSFGLVKPAGFGAVRFSLIESHFEKLELLHRYKDEAHSEFMSLRDSAMAREARTVRELRTFLQRYLKRRQATLGPLNWRMALYGELIQHTPFLRQCLAP